MNESDSTNLDLENLIQNSKVFCMMPWIHFHIWPGGEVYPCCLSDPRQPFSKYEGNLDAIVNSKAMKDLRAKMLQDIPSASCQRCYELERVGLNTLRQGVNKKYIENHEIVAKTTADGSIRNFKMLYLDIKFSNLCNLKCRSCGPQLSTTWYDDYKAINSEYTRPKLLNALAAIDFWPELSQQLEYVDQAFFAGGEPLISAEMYKVFDFWIEKNKTNIQINITTNFTTLKFGNKNILNYWNRMPNTTVSASLDASGVRAEYLRKGCDWDTVVENRKKMIEACPNTLFEIAATISVFNVLHFPDFHYDWIKLKLVDPNQIRITLLTRPEYLSIKIIPFKHRSQLIEKWELSTDRLRQELMLTESNTPRLFKSYAAVIRALKDFEYLDLSEQFLEKTMILDRVRQEDAWEIFPELELIIPHAKA
jgi:MoaA/NifB/PqqE/SkfB family radical SAM enzyme